MTRSRSRSPTVCGCVRCARWCPTCAPRASRSRTTVQADRGSIGEVWRMLYFSRWKTAAILGTTLIVCLAALTNVLPAATFDSLPGWAQRKIELGMDLRGGTHVQLAVDTQ